MIVQPPIVHPLTSYQVFLFDADGTLRETTVPGQPCPNGPDEWRLRPNVKETLAAYRWGTDCFAGICTNQGGVGHGFLTLQEATRLVWLMIDEAFAADRNRLCEPLMRLCPHRVDADCYCRKPSPWMALDVLAALARRSRAIKLSHVLYVGDQISDLQMAERAGIDFCWAEHFFGWSGALVPQA